MSDWIASRAQALDGTVRVPGDKSISHRALMLGALADGTCRIDGFLEGEDTLATARIFGQLGVRIDTPAHGVRIVHGVGCDGLQAPGDVLDCGNAGTAMRLLAGLLAGQPFASVLDGDASLRGRPMARVVEPLSRMGARITSQPGALPPLRIAARDAHGDALQAIDFTPAIASAQVKSAVLLAGLRAAGTTIVREPHPTRDYTERMLAAFGWPVAIDGGVVRVPGGHRLAATDVQVPADFSSAAFFIVAACVVPGAELTLRQVGINPRRTGLLQVLRAMGADITELDVHAVGGERVADLRVRHAPLHGVSVPVAVVPDMIDEFPALFVAAACATGATVMTGLAELRVKESDRLGSMARALRTLGISVDECDDGATIHGGTLHGGRIDSHGDHRIAMAAVIAGQVATGEVLVGDVDNVATSFPGFVAMAQGLGCALREA